MNRGVTMLEILVVIIIICILAAIAVPVYTNKVERAYGERAISNIELIVDAIKIYRKNHGGNYPAGNFHDEISGWEDLQGLENISPGLGLDLVDQNFDYVIHITSGGIGSPPPWLFPHCAAFRNSGPYGSRKITYFASDHTKWGWANISDYEILGHEEDIWPWHP